MGFKRRLSHHGEKTITDLEELLVGMSDNLASITTKLETMEGLLNMVLEENKSLKTELVEKNHQRPDQQNHPARVWSHQGISIPEILEYSGPHHIP